MFIHNHGTWRVFKIILVMLLVVLSTTDRTYAKTFIERREDIWGYQLFIWPFGDNTSYVLYYSDSYTLDINSGSYSLVNATSMRIPKNISMGVSDYLTGILKGKYIIESSSTGSVMRFVVDLIQYHLYPDDTISLKVTTSICYSTTLSTTALVYRFDGFVPKEAVLPTTKEYQVGSGVTVKPPLPVLGYYFGGWIKMNGGVVTNNTNIFMPESDYILHGSWIPSSDTIFKVELYQRSD